jgi:hypothetical protein
MELENQRKDQLEKEKIAKYYLNLILVLIKFIRTKEALIQA